MIHISENGVNVSTAELIRRKIEELPAGQPFTPAAFLSIAERSSVDKTLGRLVRSGVLIKPTRGVFVRPKESKFGAVPPEPIEVALAKMHGEAVEIHGAEAVRRFGLSTQVPVRLQHVSPRKLIYPGTKVGMAISALWYLGKEQVNREVFDVIRSQLSTEEYAMLKAAAPRMPAWMADGLHKYEKGRTHG